MAAITGMSPRGSWPFFPLSRFHNGRDPFNGIPATVYVALSFFPSASPFSSRLLLSSYSSLRPTSTHALSLCIVRSLTLTTLLYKSVSPRCAATWSKRTSQVSFISRSAALLFYASKRCCRACSSLFPPSSSYSLGPTSREECRRVLCTLSTPAMGAMASLPRPRSTLR
jgi:hypothetical protein